VAAAGSKPALLSLFALVKEHMQDHFQTIAHPKSAQQQQYNHNQQQPASRASTDAPAAKKQRTADPEGSTASDSSDSQVALDALLTAYAATSNNAATCQAGGNWRVEFLGLMQELPVLHMPLLQRLLGSLRGSAWPSEVSPQQVGMHHPADGL
jgi:hypothetical protein